jgi:hypothetical protein
MKRNLLFIIAILLLLSSCIVKSLHPFYTKDSVFHEKRLKGFWEDDKKGTWSVKSIKEEAIKDDDSSKWSLKDKKMFLKYKKGYFIQYAFKGDTTQFITMPFKIKKQLFLDFYPIDFDEGDLNNLLYDHLLKTHSLAKVDFFSDNKINLSWLSQSKISDLLKNKEIAIKHEYIGMDEDLIITATSEELHNFLENYMVSDIKDKWKTKVSFILAKKDTIR